MKNKPGIRHAQTFTWHLQENMEKNKNAIYHYHGMPFFPIRTRNARVH
jgi:hypothetical protein